MKTSHWQVLNYNVYFERYGHFIEKMCVNYVLNRISQIMSGVLFVG